MRKIKKENTINWISKKHRDLDSRAAELQSRKYLTSAEQQELREIKMEKLHSKDTLVPVVGDLM